MKKSRLKIATGNVEGFFERIRSNAKKLDEGEILPAEIRITFEDPAELAKVLSSERVRLLRQAKAGSMSISELASELDRDIRAVSRDVEHLEKAGLLRTDYRTNPGHGRCKIVRPLAQEYVLTATL